MRVLFIHQNMPGQFVHLVRRLSEDENNQVVFITQRRDLKLPKVMKLTYEPPKPSEPTDLATVEFSAKVNNGRLVARACELLKSRDLTPDVIIGHPGWGEMMFVRDVFPVTPILNYCEFFREEAPGAQDQVQASALSLDAKIARRLRGSHLLISLAAADRGVSPTHWQRSLFPRHLQSKIDVVFDGIETSILKPDEAATFQLPDGNILTQEDEVVTYAARALEPTRLFPEFMRAVPHILAKRPTAQIVIAGREDGRYDPAPAPGMSWRQKMSEEVTFDTGRVHFVGHLEHKAYVKLLQVSSAHVYLTTPTVLSWSFFDALAVGCLLIASDAAPVREVLVDGVNGFLAPARDAGALAEKIHVAMDSSEAAKIRRQAIKTIQQRYSTAVCIPQQLELIARLGGAIQPTVSPSL